MIDPAVWIERMFTQDETDEAFLGLFGETVREVLPGVEGV
jgi:hypothetical protein